MEMERKRGSHTEREKRESRERKKERVMVCLHILYFSIFNEFFSVSGKHFFF